ncbi:hypothetical protein C6P46_002973, partial [Rhodotorula mucilaginosa]
SLASTSTHSFTSTTPSFIMVAAYPGLGYTRNGCTVSKYPGLGYTRNGCTVSKYPGLGYTRNGCTVA